MIGGFINTRGLKAVAKALGTSLRRKDAQNLMELYGSVSTSVPVKSYRTITVVLECRSNAPDQALEEYLSDVAGVFKAHESYFSGAIIKGVRAYVRKPPRKK